MLCMGIDSTKTWLMGCWNSNPMMDYLHIQLPSLVKDFAPKILAAGSYSLLPGTRKHGLVHKVQGGSPWLAWH